jgi:hypothetical protein
VGRSPADRTRFDWGQEPGYPDFALADLLSRRGLERPCETLVTWAREA